MQSRFAASVGLVIAVTACVSFTSPGAALAGDDWTQFRGPTGQGVSDSIRLPLTWSETENIAWKTPIPGKGWSSPVVLGNQIWMTTALDEGHSLRAVCVDRKSGRIVHDTEVFHLDNPIHVNAKNSHASPTPVLEPGRLYVHFGAMGTACVSTDTGKTLWTKTDLKLDHSQGPGSSPILYGNLLIVTCDGMDVQYVIALDKATGEKVWKTNRSGKMHDREDRRKAFATPSVLSIDGRDELICPAANQVLGYDPATGTELWKVRYNGYSNVPRPVYGDGLIFIGTGFDKAQLWAIRPDGQGDVTGTHVAWKYTREAPLEPSPVFAGHELYVVSDSGIATCLDAKSGRERWRHRLGSSFAASPIVADGRIYFFAESGDTTVIEPAAEYKELALNRLDGRIMASPAVVGQSIILRTDTHLYRIEGK
jgi:outer membrane protein assembly factor BamB